MKISEKGVLEIAEHEGIVLGPYKDSVGVWTYGVGHTAAAGLPNPEQMIKEDTRSWNDNRVESELLKIVKLFDKDLDNYEDRVNRAIRVPQEQHQFDALCSFDFNTGGIHRANLTKVCNAGGSVEAVGNGFMGWLKPKEITKRRTAEMKLYKTGDYDANGDLIPIYDSLGNGKFKYRTKISGNKLAELMSTVGTDHKPAISEHNSFIDKLIELLKGMKK